MRMCLPRGMPRWPSMEAVRAVDSPQTKAPAPWLMRMSKLKPEPRMSSPSRLRSRAVLEGVAQALHGERVLVAHVDVALHGPVAGADGEGGDDHALDDAVRVALEHRAVHERARVALVGVADDVVLLARVGAAEAPLLAGREAGAAAAAQAARLDFVDHGLRVGGAEHLGQRRVAAVGQVVVERVRVDLAVEARARCAPAARRRGCPSRGQRARRSAGSL